MVFDLVEAAGIEPASEG